MRRTLSTVLRLFAALVTLQACSGPGLINALASREGYSVRRDLAYGEGERRSLDLYVPDQVADDAPLVVFLYGGGWNSGSKDLYLFAGQAFASRGYVTAVPDYRVYPDALFPGFVEDAAAAVAWLAREAARPDGRPRPVILVGHSAGAQIAALLALDPRYLGAQGLAVCGTIAGMVGLAGPYDFLPMREERYRRVFPEALLSDSQPINFVADPAPPLLLLTGSGDDTVDPGNSLRLAERARAAGRAAELRTYAGLGHLAIAGALAAPLRGRAPVLSDIVAFIERRRAADAPYCR